jgi:hypothetical protein
VAGFSTPQKRAPVPGTHITDQQAKLYMHLRRTHSRGTAAAKAGFSSSTGARLAARGCHRKSPNRAAAAGRTR